MNSFTNNSNVNHVEVCQTSSKRRDKEGSKEKKSKRQRVVRDAIENIDANNAQTEEPTGKAPESPIYIPTLSSPEPGSPEACVDAPIQSHASVELATFNQLSSGNVSRLRQERDRLQFGGLDTFPLLNWLNVTNSMFACDWIGASTYAENHQ